MNRRQAPWMCFAQEGDVLKTPNGDYRVIRAIGRFPDGDLRSATFAIRRCSWTGRGYTVYGFTSLLQWEFVMARPKGKSRKDKILDKEVHAKRAMPKILSCCDVREMP